MHYKTVVNLKGKTGWLYTYILKTDGYHMIIKAEFILELCKRHELQIIKKQNQNLVLRKGEVRIELW